MFHFSDSSRWSWKGEVGNLAVSLSSQSCAYSCWGGFCLTSHSSRIKCSLCAGRGLTYDELESVSALYILLDQNRDSWFNKCTRYFVSRLVAFKLSCRKFHHDQQFMCCHCSLMLYSTWIAGIDHAMWTPIRVTMNMLRGCRGSLLAPDFE
jgi:hypothetical protein